MEGAADSSTTQKIGPRALSFLVQPGPGSPLPLTNCVKQQSAAAKAFVTGEGGDAAAVFPLVAGWWRFKVVAPGMSAFVVQLPPSRVGTADAFADGHYLVAGEFMNFYVDQDVIDGVLMVLQCGPSVATLCDQTSLRELPLAIVNRLESVLPGSETGNTVSAEQLRPKESPANFCGRLAGP